METYDASQDLTKIIADLKEAKAIIAAATAGKARLEAELMAALGDQVQSQLAGNDYGTGTANVVAAGHKIKVVVSKKVSYDQQGLKALADTLAARGEEPSEYLDIKYGVAEGAYKNWPSSLQALVEPHRTVEPSKPTITIEG